MVLGFDAYSYYLVRCLPDGLGGYEPDGEELDLERDFVGLRYKSLSGLGNVGKVRGIYEEEYAEVDGVEVHISADIVREGFDLVLSLYFFPPDGVDDVDGVSLGAAISSARSVYERFVCAISGCLLVYRDTCRQRRVLCYLSDAVEPDVDSVNGVPYLSAAFKLQSVLGSSCGLSGDDSTIEDWLGVDSLPVYGS